MHAYNIYFLHKHLWDSAWSLYGVYTNRLQQGVKCLLECTHGILDNKNSNYHTHLSFGNAFLL